MFLGAMGSGSVIIHVFALFVAAMQRTRLPTAGPPMREFILRLIHPAPAQTIDTRSDGG